MSLFSMKEIQDKKLSESVNSGSQIATGKRLMAMTEARESMEHVVSLLQPDMVIKYYTSGAWSMYHLIERILEHIGPAHIVLSTWTISEDTARMLATAKEEGQVLSVKALFDYRVRERKAEAHQLLMSICDDLALGKCHAKVTVLTNDEYQVSIVGSANLSENRRLEAGTIFTTPSDVAFDQTYILQEIQKSKDHAAAE